MREVYRQNVEAVRKSFEGCVAIYVEYVVRRVRITGMRADLESRVIHAELEEMPTPGLDAVMPSGLEVPPKWSISAGFRSEFSEHTWAVAYGGWMLINNPAVIDGVTALAAKLATELDSNDRLDQIHDFIAGALQHEGRQRVFPEP